MKKTGIIICCCVLISFFFICTALSQPQPGYVRVPSHTLSSGEVIPGYWRAPFKKGFYWVEGKEDESGNWIPGHWHPVKPAPKGQVWVPDYFNGMVWVQGYRRPVSRPGYIWVDPYWHGGRWRAGYWRAYKGGHPWRSRFPKR